MYQMLCATMRRRRFCECEDCVKLVVPKLAEKINMQREEIGSRGALVHHLQLSLVMTRERGGAYDTHFIISFILTKWRRRYDAPSSVLSDEASHFDPHQ